MSALRATSAVPQVAPAEASPEPLPAIRGRDAHRRLFAGVVRAVG
jgi:hypothetical protein